MSPPDTVTQQPDHNAMQFSALQLAWLQELGIEKPWLPVAPSSRLVKSASGVLTTGQTVVKPDALQASASAPVFPVSGQDTFVQAGALAREQVGQPASPIRTPPERGATGKKSVAKAGEPSPEKLLDTAFAARQATTLEELAISIAQCNACGLCTEREQVVVGEGVMQPAIMVIGEGPGEQEDRQGQPFVGRSGMLLDNMLAAIGSGRTSDVYVTNIIKCRPPGNRNPRPDEVAACRPFLMRQIELVRPFSILALGRFAAHTLLGGNAQLAEMRHQPFTLEHAGMNVPVVVSYHPAYLLRRPADKAAAWQDLQRARQISKG